ncbi:hypothetical protein J2Y03_001095 [Neobacillus niacini]|nr:hypothetical protein [Neobacillus niacini]
MDITAIALLYCCYSPIPTPFFDIVYNCLRYTPMNFFRLLYESFIPENKANYACL